MNNLEDIKNRLAAATPGPWHRPLNTRYKATVRADLPEGEEPMKWRDGIDPDGNRETVTVVQVPVWSHGKHLRKRSGRDLEFIAHAPEDIARLVKALEAVQEQLLWAEACKTQWTSADSLRAKITEALDS